MRTHFLFLFLIAGCCSAFAAPDAVVPPVIVTAKKILNHTLTHAPKTIITKADLSSTGATSLAQALQELGGVQLQDTSGNGSQVLLSMRGFGANASSNTLLLLNGIPIINPDMMPPDLNAIPIQEIEFIEVVGGTESVLYGDQAVGGIINIVTHKQEKEKATVLCSGGSYNSRNCYAGVNHKIKNVDFGFNVLSNHTDNYRVRNDYKQNHLAGQADYAYQTGKLAFNYQVANEHMQYPGALTAAQVQQDRRQAKNATDFFRNWNGFYHLQDQQQLGSNWQLESNFVRREMHGDGVLTQGFTQSRTTHFLKPQLKGTIGKALLTCGLDFENDAYHLDGTFGVTNDDLQKYGLFALFNYPINSKLSLSIGARGAQQNNQLTSFQSNHSINRALATTVGTTFQLNTATQFYLRRAENFRFPKADENASTPIGVHGLRTQRGASYETGFAWNYKQFIAQFGAYLLNLRDEITFDPTQTAEDPFGTNRNLAPTVRHGFSVSENYQVTENIALSGQYNFVNARFQSGQNTGKRIPLVSENIFHAGANLKMNAHWNLFTEAIFTGNQYAANDNANIAGRTGGYTTYNFNLRYQFKQFSAAFRVNNIFNKYYYFYTVFQPSMNQEFFYPAPGRNFLLTLKYVFL